MQVLIPDNHVAWTVFSAVLAVVGGLAAIIALLPSSWLDRACKIGPDTQDRSFVPIKFLGGFAGLSYLLIVGLDFAPLTWHPAAQVVYLLCPACVLTVTVDPSFRAVLFGLAPLTAAAYGSLGAVLGYLFLAVRNRL